MIDKLISHLGSGIIWLDVDNIAAGNGYSASNQSEVNPLVIEEALPCNLVSLPSSAGHAPCLSTRSQKQLGTLYVATVSYKNASRIYDPQNDPAVNQLSLDIADGEFLVLVGPSGCGKSTALRMLAGLEPVDGGTILIDDKDVTNVEAQKRDIAMVFQNYALYPHMTVADNMSFSLMINKVPKAQREQKVKEAAALLDLTEYLDRKPGALSGGQRQRVAMGRAIVRSPKVFLMDEPLSNLDAKLRVQTRTQISALTRRLGVTTVYVTHDQVEAMTMGDRVCVLKDGVLQQVATPQEIYDTPANIFVAGFIGSPAMNMISAEHDGMVINAGSMKISGFDEALTKTSSRALVLGVRPEDFTFNDETVEGWPVKVGLTEVLGADAYVYGKLQLSTGEADVVLRVDGRNIPSVGDVLNVAPNPLHMHLFDRDTGLRLNGEIPKGTPHAEFSDIDAVQSVETK